jgi:hypothetical protein
MSSGPQCPPLEPILIPHVFSFAHIECERASGEFYLNDNEDRTVKKAVEARGARLGRPVLVVLIVSLVAVIGILSLIFYGNFG